MGLYADPLAKPLIVGKSGGAMLVADLEPES